MTIAMVAAALRSFAERTPDGTVRIPASYALRLAEALLQAQDSQAAQVAQPSNHPAFVAGPADAPQEETQKMSDCNGRSGPAKQQGHAPIAKPVCSLHKTPKRAHYYCLQCVEAGEYEVNINSANVAGPADPWRVAKGDTGIGGSIVYRGTEVSEGLFTNETEWFNVGGKGNAQMVCDALNTVAGPADAGSHKRTPEEIAKEIALGGLCEHLYACNCLAEAIAQGIREAIANFAAADAGSHETLRALIAKWRDEADGVTAMGYSQQADRMRDCADELEAALAASASAPAAPRETKTTE
jgi:hypothetical protein